MKILGIVGSSRKNGNTDILVKRVLRKAEELNAETEIIYLGDVAINECLGCDACKYNFKCVIDDDMQWIYQKINEADGIVLGSPTYFYNVSGLTKMFMDRLYLYEVFDDEDRSVWSSLFELTKLKFAVTVAVCEQENEEDMGVTSMVMRKTLEAVGIQSVAEIKGFHLLKRGDATKKTEILEEADKAAVKLVKRIKLSDKIK